MVKDKKWSDFSRKGGEATRDKYGTTHFSNAGKKSAEVRVKKYGKDYFKKLSLAGVEARKRKKAEREQKEWVDSQKTEEPEKKKSRGLFGLFGSKS